MHYCAEQRKLVMMMKNVTPTQNYEYHTTVIERIFPWTQGNVTNNVSNNQKVNEPIKQQVMDKNPIEPTTVQQTIPTTVQQTIPTTVQQTIPTTVQQTIPNAVESVPYTLPIDTRNTSVFEKWNIIESIGIKRQMLDKVFTTDEAVSELYNLIVNRIHYDREREMINRLRAHVERLKQRN